MDKESPVLELDNENPIEITVEKIEYLDDIVVIYRKGGRIISIVVVSKIHDERDA